MTKKTTHKMVVRKLVKELVCLAIVVLGIVLFILNITKTIPGFDNNMQSAISILISYSFIIGPIFVVLGIGSFIEVRNTKILKRKTR